MQYFPIFFDLKDQPVLVIGGGEVALRKVSLLERAGARIRLVAPRLTEDLAERAASGTLDTAVREFLPEDLKGVRLVIVATSRRAVNRWIATLCEARALPVNVVDDRNASRFIMPAIIDRDPVLLAVSTGRARASQSAAIQRFTARREVATITSRTPARSSGTNSRTAASSLPLAARRASSGLSVGATSRMAAPARSSSDTLRSATSPPPTMSTFCPSRLKKTGK